MKAVEEINKNVLVERAPTVDVSQDAERPELEGVPYEDLCESSKYTALEWAKDHINEVLDISDDITERVRQLATDYGIDIDLKTTSCIVGDRSEYVAVTGTLDIKKFLKAEDDVSHDDIVKTSAWQEAKLAASMLSKLDLNVKFEAGGDSGWKRSHVKYAECDLDQISEDDIEERIKISSSRIAMAYASMNLEEIFQKFIEAVNAEILESIRDLNDQTYTDEWAIDWMDSNQRQFYPCGVEINQDHEDDECDECEALEPPTDSDGNIITVDCEVTWVEEECEEGQEDEPHVVGKVNAIDCGKSKILGITWSDGTETNTDPDNVLVVQNLSARERLAELIEHDEDES